MRNIKILFMKKIAHYILDYVYYALDCMGVVFHEKIEKIIIKYLH